jgi:hypothetical protein
MAGYRIIVASSRARRHQSVATAASDRSGHGHHFAIIAGAQWAMFALSQGRVAPVPVPESIVAGPAARRPLCEADAVDIWIARWLRVRRKELLARYGCDPRRLYEIWEEKRFVGSRDKARALFIERYPGLVDRIDYGRHRTIPRKPPPELQPGLFDALEPAQR